MTKNIWLDCIQTSSAISSLKINCIFRKEDFQKTLWSVVRCVLGRRDELLEDELDKCSHFYVSFFYLENVGHFKIWKKTSIFLLCELLLLSIISHFYYTMMSFFLHTFYQGFICPTLLSCNSPKCVSTIPLLPKETSFLQQ